MKKFLNRTWPWLIGLAVAAAFASMSTAKKSVAFTTPEINRLTGEAIMQSLIKYGYSEEEANERVIKLNAEVQKGELNHVKLFDAAIADYVL